MTRRGRGIPGISWTDVHPISRTAHTNTQDSRLIAPCSLTTQTKETTMRNSLVRRDGDEQRRPGLALSLGGVREALGSLEAELHARDRAEGEVLGEVEGPAGLRLLVALLPKCSISISMTH